MDDVDDLGVIDPLQVDRGDAEVGVAELPLDHIERHPFARHFDGMSVAKLMRRDSSSDPGLDRQATQLARTPALVQGRPAVAPLMTQKSGPTGSPTRYTSQG